MEEIKTNSSPQVNFDDEGGDANAEDITSDDDNPRVFSEVHVEDCPVGVVSDKTPNKRFVSRFEFYLREDREEIKDNEANDSEAKLDDDGDLIVPRKRKRRETITVLHALETLLDSAGLQLWRGSLLLGDFIIHNEKLFKDQFALEIGAGVGLCGLLLARIAKRVFVTDYMDTVLINCQKNGELNSHHFCHSSVMKIRRFDWECSLEDCPFAQHFDMDSYIKRNKEKEYSWTLDDVTELKKVAFVLAADVIYDETITNALFSKLKLVLKGGRTLYMSLEKRINFCWNGNTLDVHARAYEHFLLHLFATEDTEDPLTGEIIPKSCYTAEKVDVEQIPRYFDYQRTPELELWKISLKSDGE